MKKPIQKEMLSLQMFQKWMDEYSVLAVNEEAKLQENPSYKMKSFINADIEAHFCNKPICKSCVHCYRNV